MKEQKTTSMLKKIAMFGILSVFLFGSVQILLDSSSNQTSSTEQPAHILVADTHTWFAAADGDFNIAGNWNPASVPVDGDSLIFDATSIKNCTMNTNLVFASISMNVGFGPVGRVIQASSFSTTGDFTVNSGNWVPSSSYWLTVGGNITRAGGTGFTSGTTNLNLTGIGKYILGAAFSVSKLNVTGTITMSNGYLVAYSNMRITGSLTLPLIANHIDTPNAVSLATVSGSLIGPGFWGWWDVAGTATPSITGSLSCDIHVTSNTASSFYTTVGTNIATTGNFVLDHTVVGQTYTLDLSANNYALSATDITIGLRGILYAHGSTITAYDDWDSKNGTFDRNTSTVKVLGDRLITTGVGTGGFYNLEFAQTGKTVTGGENLIVWNDVKLLGGTYDMQTYVWKCVPTGSFTGTGTITGDATNNNNLGTFRPYLGNGVWNVPTWTFDCKIAFGSEAATSMHQTIGSRDLSTSKTIFIQGGQGAPTAHAGIITNSNNIQSPTIEFGGLGIASLNITGGSIVTVTTSDFTLSGAGVNSELSMTTGRLSLPGDADFSLGTVNRGHGEIEMTGTAKTLTSTQTLYNLTISATGNVALMSNIAMDGTLDVRGNLDIGTYYLNVSSNETAALALNGTYTGIIRLHGPLDNYAVFTDGIATGSIYSDEILTIETGQDYTLQMQATIGYFSLSGVYINAEKNTNNYLLMSWAIDNSVAMQYSTHALNSAYGLKSFQNGDETNRYQSGTSGPFNFTGSGPSLNELRVYNPFGVIFDMASWMLAIGVGVGLSAIVIVAIGSRLKRR